MKAILNTLAIMAFLICFLSVFIADNFKYASGWIVAFACILIVNWIITINNQNNKL